MEGILIVNKEKGYTSHDIVSIVKKRTNEKVGHTGTLDPNATGVLPLLIGKATLISKYLIEHDKTYLATLKLGKRTTTADSEGEIIEECEVKNIQTEEVEKVLKSFLGKQIQTPPIYSAIKVKGKKLYEYARQGKNDKVDIPERKIEIYNIELKEIRNDLKEIVFEVSCSKGTYIRSLCEDIATKLETVGYMSELTRLQVGRFKIEDSIAIEEIKNNSTNISKKIITIEKFFENKEKIVLEEVKEKMFLNGVKLKTNNKEGLYRIYKQNGMFLGLGIVKNSTLKRDIII